MTKTLLIFLLVVVPLTGCASNNLVQKNGSSLNQKVGEGIQKNQVEIEKMIRALADVERAVLDQGWDNVYSRVEKSYMAKHAVTAEASLAQDQRTVIAASAAKTYHNLRGKIAAIENTLISQTRSNSKTIVEINNEVTKYLLAVRNLDSASSNIESKLASMVGINLSGISGLAKSLIEGI